MNKKIESNNEDLSSFDNRLSDLLKKDVSLSRNFGAFVNPYNVKALTETALDNKNSPLLNIIYQDILEKSEIAIRENRLLNDKDVFALTPIMTDPDLRKEIIKDYLSDLVDKEIQPKTVFKFLRTKKVEIKNALIEFNLLDKFKWNTMLPVGKEQRYLILCALQNKANAIADMFLPQITKEEFRKEVESIPMFKSSGSDIYAGHFNEKNSISFLITYGDIKFNNKIIDLFSDCFTKEVKFMLLKQGSSIIDGCKKAQIDFEKKGKFSITHVSEEDYGFVQRLKRIITKEEYNEYLKANFGFQRNDKDFFKEFDSFEFIKDKYSKDDKEFNSTSKAPKISG